MKDKALFEEFLGFQIISHRFLLVVDASQSVSQELNADHFPLKILLILSNDMDQSPSWGVSVGESLCNNLPNACRENLSARGKNPSSRAICKNIEKV